MLLLQGYQGLKTVGENEKYKTYRGYSTTDGQNVLIKIPASSISPARDAHKLILEYEISKSLDLEGIVKPNRLEQYSDSLALIMEDCGIPLRAYFDSRTYSLQKFFAVSTQLCKIIGELHVRNVIHKDINPDNIFVDPKDLKVKISGFGIGVTSAYMSPEQTGRMNRTVDYRTDLYSLGVTFFELLSGRLPFEAKEPIEWVHAHIARKPADLLMLNSAIPRMICEIIGKLLAKTVEERYQSAYGLQADLQNCSRQWFETGRIDDFPLAASDAPHSFHISQKLYGRERETALLKEAFDKTSLGGKEIVLISGEVGIGKTSLIQEIHQPVIVKNGRLISGKFGQYDRDISYQAIIQAFRSVIKEIAADKNEQTAVLKKRLLRDLGSNASVIAEVIPEIRQIIGETSPVEALSAAESQNRFESAFQKFVQSIASREHPLVIVLDDLQWADSASLNLLDIIMRDSQSRYLLFIGAYRETEDIASQPFFLKLGELRRLGISMLQIQLIPLSIAHLRHLIIDTLYCDEEIALELCTVLFGKTVGNPFYFKLLFQAAYKQGLLAYNTDRNKWEWNVMGIANMPDFDELLDFLIHKIGRLPKAVREALSLAACLGNRFELQLLASVYGKPVSQTAADLREAVIEGLILPLHDANSLLMEGSTSNQLSSQPDHSFYYQFVHDRVQQAAYSFVKISLRKQVHLAAGRLLVEKAGPNELYEHLFEIANHFNQAIDSASSASDRDLLIEFNYNAGKKAKLSQAYEAALNYYQTAAHFITEKDWSSRHDFCFDLHLNLKECQYLSGHSAETDDLFTNLMKRSQNTIERAKLCGIRITRYVNIGKYSAAIALGLKCLQEFGIQIPQYPDSETVAKAEISAKRQIEANIDHLKDLPNIENTDMQAAAEIMLALVSPALLSNKEIFAVLISNFIELSLQYGHTSHSAHAYGTYAMHLSFELEEHLLGQKLVRTAYDLAEQQNLPSIRCILNYVMGKLLGVWEEDGRENRFYLTKALRLGLESGNFIIAGLAFTDLVQFVYTRGTLDELGQIVQTYLPVMNQTKNPFRIETFYIYLQFIGKLKGPAQENSSVRFGESNMPEPLRENLAKQEFTAMLAFRNYTYETQLHYLFGDYTDAIQSAEAALPFIKYSRFLQHLTEHHFYYSLAVAAAWETLPSKDRNKYRRLLEETQEKMKQWSALNPRYFLHKYLLISAGIAQLDPKDFSAFDLYNQAIRSAQEAGYIQNEAVANQLFAKFCLARGMEKVAEVYMKDAYQAYLKWGAAAVAEALLTKYPALLSERNSINGPAAERNIDVALKEYASITNIAESDDELDLSTILKAGQSFSEGMDLEQLLIKLMRIIIENAGAQKGCLIVDKEGELILEAAVEIDGAANLIVESVPLDQYDRLSSSIVSHVARTLDTLKLDDAVLERTDRQDKYIRRNHPKSILCLPITVKGRPNVILYLENNLATHAFALKSPDVLKLLSSQAFYVKDLIHSFGKIPFPITRKSDKRRPKLMESLTARELEVLNLMAMGFSNQEIAHELGVVVNTIKVHIKNIYGKLEVNKRMKAVAQAKELQLLRDPPL